MSQIPTLRRAGRFLRDLFRVFESSGSLDSAASLTYTTLFAVVPMVTVMWAIMKSMPQLGDMG
ncbi:MAG: ribonuclease, partial [Gammaproteobacteria bacterium]